MSCYHPLKAFPIGITENNKIKYKITGYEVDHIILYNDDSIELCSGSSLFRDLRGKIIRDYVTIPCGKCIGCQLDRSRDWATRCMLELMYHESAYFCTITYDDLHVPYGDDVVSNLTGEIKAFKTLSKRDWQLFMKKLRFHFDEECNIRGDPNSDLRFYMAGEYGSSTHRPHYHAIIFGLKLYDLVPWSKSKTGYQLYTSEWLNRIWSRGNIIIGDVTWETCAYTARYIMKKLEKDDAFYYDDICIEKPFTLMSRKPGIANQYFLDHPDLYDYTQIHISTDKGGKSYPIPKYFDRLYDVDHHSELEEIKELRKIAAESTVKLEMFNTDMDYLEYLAVKEAAKSAQIKSLKREEV